MKFSLTEERVTIHNEKAIMGEVKEPQNRTLTRQSLLLLPTHSNQSPLN